MQYVVLSIAQHGIAWQPTVRAVAVSRMRIRTCTDKTCLHLGKLCLHGRMDRGQGLLVPGLHL